MTYDCVNSVYNFFLNILQEILTSCKIVHVEWLSADLVIFVFSTGLLVAVSINSSTGDITELVFDKFLKEKLVLDRITDGKYYMFP